MRKAAAAPRNNNGFGVKKVQGKKIENPRDCMIILQAQGCGRVRDSGRGCTFVVCN